MKDKIFSKLKQAYSPLGLGDAILLGHAEALAALGLVTDDNVDAVVAAQKSFLEQLQKSADTRVQDAVSKAKVKAQTDAEAARKAAEEAHAKAIQEAVAKAKEEAEAAIKASVKHEDGSLPEWFVKQREDFEGAAKAQREAAAKQSESLKAELAKLQKNQKEQSDLIAALSKENETIKAERAKAERLGFINNKAKEMGIPQYRIDEGFAGLSETSSDDDVVATLSTVARNIKANQLPEFNSGFSLGNGEPSSAEVESLAKSIIK